VLGASHRETAVSQVCWKEILIRVRFKLGPQHFSFGGEGNLLSELWKHNTGQCCCV
jgi:hypothetical protein